MNEFQNSTDQHPERELLAEMLSEEGSRIIKETLQDSDLDYFLEDLFDTIHFAMHRISHRLAIAELCIKENGLGKAYTDLMLKAGYEK
jgi:hypothetical protein